MPPPGLESAGEFGSEVRHGFFFVLGHPVDNGKRSSFRTVEQPDPAKTNTVAELEGSIIIGSEEKFGS